MKCTACQSRPANRVLNGKLVCRQCKADDEQFRRVQNYDVDPKCTCGHAFSAHPPSPLYACAAEGCSCGVYLRDWTRSPEVQRHG